ncbi:MAG: putative multiple-sugar transport system permease YteP [Spirochaetes bacterium ADurb.Bin315]|jgi:putative aldouronate transport system permease protein|nr:sugar ABC transporter permease [Spirochaetales bacterium]OQA45279.1 MAG: putative multiple-sugar transport system permease YteP [Spirochaetes bacterium ADurb.Bin315]TAH57264.1 MAG: sugar ABC transporter permease [Sphaerochaeta sp.]HOE89807.1 ABC transporter permease subunit [Sphaerochaeta sp.]HOR80191.1 ABC transporter permease subunit [Sphaerochaeta sp.]
MVTKSRKSELSREIRRHASVYVLLIIPLVYYITFKYVPIFNGQIAFKDYMALDGVLGSRWIGLEHFRTFIQSYYFAELLRNTLMYSFGKLIFSLPLAILLAITIYESKRRRLSRTVQTLAYLPHFLSWVIMYGILLALLAPGDGVVNDIIKAFGGKPRAFLTSVETFPWIVIFSDAWKEMGWSAIIFIAALMGIDPALFEAAMVEGATSWQRVRYITLPSIRPVIVIVVLLRLGTILDAGFNQIFMLYSTPVLSVADIIDTWVYRQGLLEFQFGLATAVGLFKGAIGMLLILFTNRIVKRLGGSSLY